MSTVTHNCFRDFHVALATLTWQDLHCNLLQSINTKKAIRMAHMKSNKISISLPKKLPQIWFSNFQKLKDATIRNYCTDATLETIGYGGLPIT